MRSRVNLEADALRRIKAATKKIQLISGYEGQTEALNAEQKVAVASKPGLEAAVKELADLQKLIEVS